MLKWRPQDAALAIGIYVVLQMIFSIIWLIFAYRVAEFGMTGLTLLLRDAVVSVGLAILFVGTIHYFLHGWPAFLVSAGVALCMIAISFVRYVSTGAALSSTTERFRQFWAEQDTTLKGRHDEEFRRECPDEFLKSDAAMVDYFHISRYPRRIIKGLIFPLSLSNVSDQHIRKCNWSARRDLRIWIATRNTM
jgi:hypothetical protein